MWAAKALARVNEFRKLAGLAPVVLDAEQSRGCRMHAHYLALNLGHPATMGLGAHHEDLTLPGSSDEGDQSGKASDISIGGPDPLYGVDTWVATLYHRVPILEPTLKSVGYGSARARRQGWVTVLNVQTGRDRSVPRPHPVFYPRRTRPMCRCIFPFSARSPIRFPRTGQAGQAIR